MSTIHFLTPLVLRPTGPHSTHSPPHPYYYYMEDTVRFRHAFKMFMIRPSDTDEQPLLAEFERLSSEQRRAVI